MTTTPRILERQCEWTSDPLADESFWTEVLSGVELEELDAALRHALAKSEDVLEIGREDFPLPRLQQRLVAIERALIDGRGSGWRPTCCAAGRRTSPTTSARTGMIGAAPAGCG